MIHTVTANISGRVNGRVIRTRMMSKARFHVGTGRDRGTRRLAVCAWRLAVPFRLQPVSAADLWLRSVDAVLGRRGEWFLEDAARLEGVLTMEDRLMGGGGVRGEVGGI